MRSTVTLRIVEITPRASTSHATPALARMSHALQLPAADKQPYDPRFEGIEMPWIWRVLRERVYSQMPTYERSSDDLKLVLSPVVVTSPSDTVPGVGISGDF